MKGEIGPKMKLHGVELHTRYGVRWEMQEMGDFVEEANRNGLSDLLGSIFYDSNNSYAVVTLRGGKTSPNLSKQHPLYAIANKHFTQFEWGGEMCHSPEKERREWERIQKEEAEERDA